jgi:hypothetical protein
MLVFDIETGPLDLETVTAFSPVWNPPPPPGEFDPAAVKCGNIGGPDSEKGKAKIAAAKAEHEATVRDYEQLCRDGELQHVAACLDRAALSPVTGQVLAVGCWSATTGNTVIIGEQDGITEADILARFWSAYLNMRGQKRQMVGVNIFGFDLPFLIRRSWILGVDVPATVREGRYWDRLFIDLRDEWLLGQRWGDCESSLDHMARALGVGSKADAAGCDGATFHRLWLSGDQTRRETARKYLVNDLELTRKVAERLGVV